MERKEAYEMNLVDFCYRNETLSDHGYMVAYVGKTPSDTVSAGSEITFDTVVNKNSHKILSLNAKYETPLSATFDIIKIPCNDSAHMNFSDLELSWLLRWLHSKTDEKFMPFYDDGSFANIYYYGKFTSISYTMCAGNVIGITVTFTSNSPFGYIEQDFQTTINSANGTFVISYPSDEIGIFYPKSVEIICNCSEISDLKISHVESPPFDTKNFMVKNCASGEIVKLDCENKIIVTSNEQHTTLFNDFNYNWISLINTWDQNHNVFCVSIPCDIKIKYELIRKAGILV